MINKLNKKGILLTQVIELWGEELEGDRSSSQDQDDDNSHQSGLVTYHM